MPAIPALDAVRVAAAELASIRSASEASAAIVRWIASAFRPTSVETRVIVQDRKGSLRPAARSAASRPSSRLPALRRAAFETKTPVRADLDGPPASALLIPLIAGQHLVGVLEVVASPGEIEPRWAVLDCLASMAAVALGSVLARAGDEMKDPRRANARRGETDQPTPSAAWMAHEIRGPLLVARATIERVMTSANAEDNRMLLQRSRAHLERLTDTVDRILDWACGGLTGGRNAIDLSALTRSATASACTEADAERVRIAAPDRLTVVGDEARLTIAVANLIRNAVKYAPAGSPVAVTVERSGNWASLRVDDSGPGVPEDERELIFAPLVRGRAGSGDDEGRGLGLFMARQAVEELGGRIWVESNGPGSSFRILIPVPAGKEIPSGS
jgi:signal transduction histidine kinase